MSKTQSIPRPVPMHGITRAQTHQAWRVSIGYLGAKETKYFRDQEHGGFNKALQAAKAFRDDIISILPFKRQLRAAKRRLNSSTMPR